MTTQETSITLSAYFDAIKQADAAQKQALINEETSKAWELKDNICNIFTEHFPKLTAMLQAEEIKMKGLVTNCCNDIPEAILLIHTSKRELMVRYFPEDDYTLYDHHYTYEKYGVQYEINLFPMQEAEHEFAKAIYHHLVLEEPEKSQETSPDEIQLPFDSTINSLPDRGESVFATANEHAFQEGMHSREYFAANAPNDIPHWFSHIHKTEGHESVYFRWRFYYADKMIKYAQIRTDEII